MSDQELNNVLNRDLMKENLVILWDHDDPEGHIEKMEKVGITCEKRVAPPLNVKIISEATYDVDKYETCTITQTEVILGIENVEEMIKEMAREMTTEVLILTLGDVYLMGEMKAISGSEVKIHRGLCITQKTCESGWETPGYSDSKGSEIISYPDDADLSVKLNLEEYAHHLDDSYIVIAKDSEGDINVRYVKRIKMGIRVNRDWNDSDYVPTLDVKIDVTENEVEEWHTYEAKEYEQKQK